jgi:hypothetical protein
MGSEWGDKYEREEIKAEGGQEKIRQKKKSRASGRVISIPLDDENANEINRRILNGYPAYLRSISSSVGLFAAAN